MVNLKGKTAIVTGAIQGIGLQTASLLAEHGANVVINGRTDNQKLKDAVDFIDGNGSNVKGVLADVSNRDEAEKVINAALDFGGVDILINNAGGLINRVLIADYNEDHFDKVISSNLKTVFVMTSLAIPHMEKQNGGRIINLSSLAGYDGGGPGAAAYATTKAGIVAFTKALVKEVQGKNIICNAISPGFIQNTNFHNTFTSQDVQRTFKAFRQCIRCS